MNQTVLIIGATGGVGGATATAFLKRGWTVRALNRHPEQAKQRSAALGNIEWIAGDSMSPEDVIRAAQGVSVIVHGANPPGYRNWRGLALPMLESSIAAARAAGARLVFPGTVYNFGPDAFPNVTENARQVPQTRKGRIRVEMEQRLERAAREEGVPVLIVRAGDFFGGTAANSWFSRGLVKPGKPLAAVTYPGKREVGHAWAYLPDLAETIALLVERQAELARFEVFHFGGHWFEQGAELADATRRAAGVPNAPIKRFPWLAIYLLSPFVETFREMLEMRYLWQQPVRLDNRKLVGFLGQEPHTPLERALGNTLRELGCAA